VMLGRMELRDAEPLVDGPGAGGANQTSEVLARLVVLMNAPLLIPRCWPDSELCSLFSSNVLSHNTLPIDSSCLKASVP
jgi:hypothetical protein